MHKANLKRLTAIRDEISFHIKENPPPDTSIYFLLKWIRSLVEMADEIHLRLEANDPEQAACQYCNHPKAQHERNLCWGKPKVKGLCDQLCKGFKS